MNRTIKFRAWDGETMYSHESIGEDYDFQIGVNGLILMLNEQFHECGSGVAEEYWQYVDTKAEFMQFTGLTDKNGVDIYEGDIIQFTYWWFDGNEAETLLTGEIVYSDHSMSFQLKGVKNKEWQKHTGYGDDCDYLTPFSELNFEEADFHVIGNIHQNSDLLGGDE